MVVVREESLIARQCRAMCQKLGRAISENKRIAKEKGLREAFEFRLSVLCESAINEKNADGS
jgi:hypothetical protein